MNDTADKRTRFRRYEDRRLAMLFEVYKIFFEDEPGVSRDKKILLAVLDNFKVDRALIVDIDGKTGSGVIRAYAGKVMDDSGTLSVGGKGFDKLRTLHDTSPGALSLERVRKPDMFASDLWDSLWDDGVSGGAHSLLSIDIVPRHGPRHLLWLQQLNSSREWGSRDRDLIEELGEVLAHAADKTFGVK